MPDIWYRHPNHKEWKGYFVRLPHELGDRLQMAAKIRMMSKTELMYRIFQAWADQNAPALEPGRED